MFGRSVVNCPICLKLGEKLYVNNDRGEKLPPEASLLEEVAGSVLGAVVKKCPHCGTYYSYDHSIDNEPGLSFDVTQLRRIRRDEAKKAVEAERRYAEKRRKNKI